jgi:2,3-bisphosphoglycerate-dependent phosphoglycerate mutase
LTIAHLALNERDYGDLSGLNKDDARKKWGEEQVHDLAPLLRRAAARRRKPEGHAGAHAALLRAGDPARVLRGERTLVAAHGNSLRALIMVLDR